MYTKSYSPHAHSEDHPELADTPQVWIKPPGELPFLYGNHVVKAHLGRITEDTPEHQGVVVFSMSDIPLVSPSIGWGDALASEEQQRSKRLGFS
jgi:ribosome biogenesis protein Nip4